MARNSKRDGRTVLDDNRRGDGEGLPWRLAKDGPDAKPPLELATLPTDIPEVLEGCVFVSSQEAVQGKSREFYKIPRARFFWFVLINILEYLLILKCLILGLQTTKELKELSDLCMILCLYLKDGLPEYKSGIDRCLKLVYRLSDGLN